MIKRYFNIFVALIVATLFATSCQNERALDLYEEGEYPFNVSFEVKDFDVVELRSHLRPEDEHAVDGLAIWVFDIHGNLYTSLVIDDASKHSFVAQDEAVTSNSADGKVGVGNPSKGTKTLGDISNELQLKLKSKDDKLTIVALANFNSSNFAIESADGTKFTSKADFERIKTLDELKSMRLNTNIRNSDKVTTELYESPVLYALREVTPADIYEGRVVISLIPYNAKYTATVKVGSNVTVHSLSIKFENIPTRTNIFGAPFKLQDTEADQLRLLNSQVEEMQQVTEKEYVQTGYLAPNFAKSDALITLKAIQDEQQLLGASEANSGFSAFDLRQKQLKNSLGGTTVQNGDYQYAPKVATSMLIRASVTEKVTTESGLQSESLGEINYRIMLGDISGVTSWTNPTEADLEKINNYILDCATHYKYTVTINGLNNIKVEAETYDSKDEPNPSTDGMVLTGRPRYKLDSHYEQRTVLLNYYDFGIFQSGGVDKMVDNPKMSFYVQTPFNPDITTITYSVDEARKLINDGPQGSKKVDNGWVRIYVHDPNDHGKQFDVNNLPDLLYTNGINEIEYGNSTASYVKNLMTVEQFIAQMLTNPKPFFDQKSNICITFFFDEYFYEKNPLQDGAQKDPTLWKTFANAPERRFGFLLDELDKSPDQKSIHADDVYCSFSQYSIKTIFTKVPEGIQVWGVESIDETPNLRYNYKNVSTSIPRLINISLSNGWINTWNLISGYHTSLDKDGVGGYAAFSKKNNHYVMFRPYFSASDIYSYSLVTKEENNSDIWSYYTRGAANGTDFREYDSNVHKIEGVPRLAMYTPFLRNRDLNRDGKMQANEMKWYIPSIFEALLFAAYQNAFPSYARLDAPMVGDYQNPIVLYSSTAYKNQNINYSANPLVVIPDYVTIVPLQDPINSWGINQDKVRSTTRLFRDLGIIEDTDTSPYPGYSYHFDEDHYKNVVNKIYNFIPNQPTVDQAESAKDWGGAFLGQDHLDERATRKAFTQNELPLHSQRDSAMRLYFKGFKLSKDYVPKLAGGNDYEKQTFNTFQSNMVFGLSPCKAYSEEPGMRDLGKWRVPNFLELSIMAYQVQDAKAYFYDQWTQEVKILWSRSVSDVVGKSVSDALFLRLDLSNNNNHIWPISTIAPKFGEVVDKEKTMGRFRCVRDLTDEEWNTYSNK